MRFPSNTPDVRWASVALILVGAAVLVLPGAPLLAPGAPRELRPPSVRTSIGDAPGSDLPTSSAAARRSVEEGRPAAVRPAAGAVNPYRAATTEPAAMGVADYGIDGSGAPYNYSTSEFVGEVQLGSVEVDSTGGAGRLLGIQLNVVLTIGPSAHPYVYWVRFAPWVNASDDVLTLQNEVFNLTTSATANPSPISGRGSINTAESDQYQYTPPCSSSYPGNCATLKLPTGLQLRAVSEDAGGLPGIEIAYDLGAGWISEDNISFPSLRGLPDHDFVVNGSVYTPTGLYYDAELVVGGPYHGYVQTDNGSRILLTLEEFNGHDLQAVPNAWDFGADSSNTFDNATATASTEGGLPADQVGGGGGTLGPLYAVENESMVSVVGIPSNGTLLIDGTSLDYTAGEALVELNPGSSTLELVVNGTVLASKSFTFTAGEVTTVSLDAFYPVTIREAGLPSGDPWSIVWQGAPTTSTQDAITVMALNGSYELRVGNVTGFVCNATSELVVVRGAGTVWLGWSPFLFEVTFAETGLPRGTVWWVTMNDQTARGPTSMLNVSAGNGTYAYGVGAPFTYVTSSPTGNVTVQGPPAPISVQFGIRSAFLAGTVWPGTASLSIDGSPVPLSSGAFDSAVVPGRYSIHVAADGYVTWSGNVTTTPGNATELQLVLNATRPSGPPPVGRPGLDPLGAVGVLLGGAVIVASVIVLARRRQRDRTG